MPRGGFYLWCRLLDGPASAEVARRCLDRAVVLAPGNVFSVPQSAGWGHDTKVSFAYAKNERRPTGLEGKPASGFKKGDVAKRKLGHAGSFATFALSLATLRLEYSVKRHLARSPSF